MTAIDELIEAVERLSTTSQNVGCYRNLHDAPFGIEWWIEALGKDCRIVVSKIPAARAESERLRAQAERSARIETIAINAVLWWYAETTAGLLEEIKNKMSFQGAMAELRAELEGKG